MGEITALLIFLALSAFFSTAETAITSLSSLKVSRMVEQRVKGAKLVKKLKENTSEFLSAILIGNNVVNVAASALATSMIITRFEALGWGSMRVAVGLATVIMTFIILTFGEIIPKTVALRKAEKIAVWVAPLILGAEFILRPIAYSIGFVSRPLILLFGGKAPEKGPFITQEEIRLILAAGEKEGVIEEEEREMITSIFEFSDTVVREVMTPRPDITAAEVNQPLSEIKQLIAESGHSRIPIFEGNLDNIVGILFAKDLLNGEKENVRELLRPVVFIPENKSISDLLHEMQLNRTHMAVIVDEFGVSAGVVTLEDLVEEIVGEIHDEFERDEKTIDKVGDKEYLVDGRVTLKDLNGDLNLGLPEKDYDTIGGFVFGRLGKLPAVGNVVTFDNLRITVERLHRRRITRVKIELTGTSQPPQ